MLEQERKESQPSSPSDILIKFQSIFFSGGSFSKTFYSMLHEKDGTIKKREPTIKQSSHSDI
nr:hypothetical protein BgiMline_007531 [Biomphalaria glabrata]